jgi:hypothetical protein
MARMRRVSANLLVLLFSFSLIAWFAPVAMWR